MLTHEYKLRVDADASDGMIDVRTCDALMQVHFLCLTIPHAREAAAALLKAVEDLSASSAIAGRGATAGRPTSEPRPHARGATVFIFAAGRLTSRLPAALLRGPCFLPPLRANIQHV